MTWKSLPIPEVLQDVSRGNLKTPQRELLQSGEVPVVDQGQGLIAGYTNDLSRICKSTPPVIVFGDHTRVVKYIDFDFAMGADGTKVLKPKLDSDAKFLFYALTSLEIPNAGYSRHFKFLKRQRIPLPPLTEQKRIVKILDAADALRTQRREAIAQLDALVQSTFLEMFGDPVQNPKGWPTTKLSECGEVQGGLQVTSARKKLPLERPYLRVANVFRGFLKLSEIKTIRLKEAEYFRTELKKDDLLIVEGHGNPQEIGRCAIWDGSIENCVHQNHIIRLRLDGSQVLPSFCSNFLNSEGGRRFLVRSGRTTSGLNTISVSKVRSTPALAPPLELQQQFAQIVESIEDQKTKHQQHLAQLDDLFACLQQRAFNGEL